MTCVFCDIAAGNAPASAVYEDERVIAFIDRHPASDHHVLVVPKRHAADLVDTPAEDAAAMMVAAQRVAEAMRSSDPRVEGVNLWMANGAAAGQDVFHAHLHVISRHAGDTIVVDMPAVSRPSREALDAAAVKLREAIA